MAQAVPVAAGQQQDDDDNLWRDNGAAENEWDQWCDDGTHGVFGTFAVIYG